MRVKLSLLLVLLATLLCAASLSFAADVDDSKPEPVAFEETIDLGLTSVETALVERKGYAVPQAQVFYSQYRYVAGYRTIGALVTEQRRVGHDQQYGRPLATYVTDFAGTEPELTDRGYIRRTGSSREWVAASDAYFVVESRAKTPAGPAVVPFSRRGAAASFASEYGGRIERWSTVQQLSFETTELTRERMQSRIPARSTWANTTMADARGLLDRPVSTVVGEDAPTLSAALERAPPNTTVVVPKGSYDANVTIRKPITIRGAGTETLLRGEGNGTVVSVRAEHVAIADLRITGIGDTIVPDTIPPERRGEYGQINSAYSDAGIAFDGANGSYVANVRIDTSASGVVVRYSDRLGIENLSLQGSKTWQEGLMGVFDLSSRIVVQESTFVGGRDGIYLHRGDGTVVRDNRMRTLRYGVHLMYTDDTLVANQTARQTDTGVLVMTNPTGNVVVDNTVRNSGVGLSVSGSGAYVTRNVVTGGGEGLSVLSKRSLYESNTIVDNEVGVVSGTLLPTNTVTRNDIVANDQPAQSELGPLRVFSDGDRGNYWGTIPGIDRDGDGALERAYVASGTVDSRAGRVPGAATLAQSPAVSVRRSTRESLPGLTGTGVQDPNPLAEPVRPDVLRAQDPPQSADAGGAS
jgi:nitrous oxidase accessory protein NosD/nitrous oxide reductase accessory protein NosL